MTIELTQMYFMDFKRFLNMSEGLKKLCDIHVQMIPRIIGYFIKKYSL